jgi:hypothetical protein
VPGPAQAGKNLTLSDKQKDEAKVQAAEQVEAELRSKLMAQKKLSEQLCDQRKDYVKLRGCAKRISEHYR